MAWTVPWNFVGLEVSGDVADLTIYTDRFGKKVAFPKAPPKEPPTFNQMIQRQRFKDGQADWMALTDEEKANLELATKKVSAPLTGQNLWISSYIRNDSSDLETFERQSGVVLPLRPPRKNVGICQIVENKFVLINTNNTMLRIRALTDLNRCGQRMSFSIDIPFDGSFNGTIKNDWEFVTHKFTFNGPNGFHFRSVLVSFTILFGCRTQLQWWIARRQ